MKLKFFSVLTLALLAFASTAQNIDDAIRYNYLAPVGSAKSVAMGGALGSIGADISAVSTNPASVGVFRTNYFSFTPSFNMSKSTASYYGNDSKVSKSKFNMFDDVGVVFSLDTEREKGCKMVNFSFAYDKFHDFRLNRMNVSGANNKGSFLDGEVYYYCENPSDDNMYLEAGAILIDTLANECFNSYQEYGQYGSTQLYEEKPSGSIGVLNFSIGCNLNDKFYIGGSLDIYDVNYSMDSRFKEVSMLPTDFENLSLSKYFSSRGSGVGVKLGGIVWLNQFVRVGAAMHSPVLLSMNDVFNSRETVSTTYIKTPNQGSSYDDFKWTMTLPGKLVGSVAMVIPSFAMLSVDCEYVNYANTSMDDGDDEIFSYNSLSGVNDEIEQTLHNALNLKAGAEINLGPAVVRGGFAYFGSPYKSGEVNESAKKMVYSAGIGFGGAVASFDLAYRFEHNKLNSRIYSTNDSQYVLKNNIGSVVATFGFRF